MTGLTRTYIGLTSRGREFSSVPPPIGGSSDLVYRSVILAFIRDTLGRVKVVRVRGTILGNVLIFIGSVTCDLGAFLVYTSFNATNVVTILSGQNGYQVAIGTRYVFCQLDGRHHSCGATQARFTRTGSFGGVSILVNGHCLKTFVNFIQVIGYRGVAYIPLELMVGELFQQGYHDGQGNYLYYYRKLDYHFYYLYNFYLELDYYLNYFELYHYYFGKCNYYKGDYYQGGLPGVQVCPYRYQFYQDFSNVRDAI